MEPRNVLSLLLLTTFSSPPAAIYVPDGDYQYQKPPYSSGIKTYERPSHIQYHHNYSKVNHQSYYDTSSPNTLDQDQERPHYTVYPVYTPPDQVYVLNGTRIRTNPVRQIANYNKAKRAPEAQAYHSCPFNATGQFVYETSCNQFLNCWRGRGHVQNCAPGTLFNPRTLECDFPDKVECITGPRLNILRTTRQQHSNLVKQIGCPKEFSGLIPNYTDCAKFINCVSGIENFMDCPEGTLFDMDRNICDFAHKARCFNGQNESLKRDAAINTNLHGCKGAHCTTTRTLNYKSHETGCPVGALGLYAHPTDCTKFLNCDRGQSFIQDCAPGTLFNPTLKICDFPYNVRCNQQQQQQQHSQDEERNTEIPTYYSPTTNHLSEHSSNRGRQHDNGRYNTRITGHYGPGYGDGTSYHTGPSNRPIINNQDTGHMGGTFYHRTEHTTYQLQTPDYYQQTQYQDGYNDNNNHYGYDNQQVHERPPYRIHGAPVAPNQYGSYNNNNRRPITGWNPDPYGATNLYQQHTNYDPGYTRHGSSVGQPYYNQAHEVRVPVKTNFNLDTDSSVTNNRNVYQQNWNLSRHSPSDYDSGYIRGYTNNNNRSNPYSGQHHTYYSNNQPHNGINRGPVKTYNHPNTGSSYNTNYHSTIPEAAINQRGESGYNRFVIGHDRPRPNYDQVVNINHGTTTYRSPLYTITPKSQDYVDTVPHHTVTRDTTPPNSERHWPPPFPSTDVNADYVFDYDSGDGVTLQAENTAEAVDECGKSEFRCSIDQCVSKMVVCDGTKNCRNGIDELKCLEYVSKFAVSKNHKLAILERERWDNVSLATCALLCTETHKFVCRSFNYRKVDRTCFLADTNEALSGALIAYYPFDYYEAIRERIDCSKGFVCSNKKCIERGRLCDGVDDCGDRGDEKGCQPQDFGYRVKLTGSHRRNEGNIEVTAFGRVGFVCDDNFGLRDADVVCKELGFELGAVEVKKNSFYATTGTNPDPFFMMDDISCTGNETRLMDCDFSGWGVHNCRGQEVAGVVCKTPQDKCPEDYWQCDSKRECLPLAFVCDGLLDCTDGSDEKTQYCDAPTQIRLVNGTSRQEGRVEIKHHGIWGTVCDDDFNEDAAKVVCRNLGYKGSATVRKDAHFGPGTGPIWLDQVFCSGNETSIEHCTHWNWGEHNCEHTEDVAVICSNIYEHERHSIIPIPKIPQSYPHRCGYRKDNLFDRDDDVHFRVVRGSVAKRGDYPWQAALRVKGKTTKAVSHWCGAVVISEKWVLTAAHCLIGYPKGAYVVVAGDYDMDETEGTEQEAYIEDYYIHEYFRDGHKMNNDIALVKLKGRGFRLNDDVQAICLPDNSTEYERADLNCTISGFGSVQSGTSAFSHRLRAGWIPIQKREVCTMPHVYGDALTQGMVCAGSLDEGIDACDGDSGGPLACLHEGIFTLYGITSWGQHCGHANKPGVYVKVGHYRNWIDENFYKYGTN